MSKADVRRGLDVSVVYIAGTCLATVLVFGLLYPAVTIWSLVSTNPELVTQFETVVGITSMTQCVLLSVSAWVRAYLR